MSCSVLMTYAYHATAGCRSSDGLAAISSKEACEAASVALGLSDTSAEAGTFNANPDNPPGCFINTGNGGLYFNNGGFTDASSSTRRSLCLRSTGSNVGVIAVDNVRYRSNELFVDDLDACKDACAALPNCTGIQHTLPYLYRSELGCPSSDGLSAVTSATECNTAAGALGLSDISASVSNDASAPRGCYVAQYFENPTAGCPVSDGVATIESAGECKAAAAAVGLVYSNEGDLNDRATGYTGSPLNPTGCFFYTINQQLYFNPPGFGFTGAQTHTSRRSLCKDSRGKLHFNSGGDLEYASTTQRSLCKGASCCLFPS